MRNYSTLSAVIALAVLSACASGRDVEGLLVDGSQCTRCHGGQDNQTGAPPYDVAGLTSSAAVGAHTAHLNAGVTCATCHAAVDLGNVDFAAHRNNRVDVEFGPAAFDPSGGVPTFIRSSLNCNVYCHSPSTVAVPGSGPASPRWNQGPLAAGCGSCHRPPATVHGTTAATACVVCHPGAVDAAGNLLAAGTHGNRTLDAYAHPSDWTTVGAAVQKHGLAATYQDLANYPTGLEGCKTCHGADLVTGISGNTPSCDGCHAGGGATWRTSCTFCHGDPTRALATRAAPPRDAAGRSTSAKVGAHLAHLVGDATNTPRLSDGVLCTDCHGGVGRAALDATYAFTHVNGATEVTLKTPGQAGRTGTYDPATGTCANTYCHGALPVNPRTSGADPTWAASALSATNRGCDACHAPQTWASASGPVTNGHAAHNDSCAPCHADNHGRMDCGQCHPGFSNPVTTAPNGTVNQASHVNGTVNLDASLNWNATARSCTPACHTAATAHRNAMVDPSGPKTW